jgi:hypothetical protein
VECGIWVCVAAVQQIIDRSCGHDSCELGSNGTVDRESEGWVHSACLVEASANDMLHEVEFLWEGGGIRCDGLLHTWSILC